MQNPEGLQHVTDDLRMIKAGMILGWQVSSKHKPQHYKSQKIHMGTYKKNRANVEQC